TSRSRATSAADRDKSRPPACEYSRREAATGAKSIQRPTALHARSGCMSGTNACCFTSIYINDLSTRFSFQGVVSRKKRITKIRICYLKATQNYSQGQ